MGRIVITTRITTIIEGVGLVQRLRVALVLALSLISEARALGACPNDVGQAPQSVLAPPSGTCARVSGTILDTLLEPEEYPVVKQTLAFIQRTAMDRHEELTAQCLHPKSCARQKPFLEFLSRLQTLPRFDFPKVFSKTLSSRGTPLSAHNKDWATGDCTVELGSKFRALPLQERAALLVHELRHFFDVGIQERLGPLTTEERAYEAEAIFWGTVRPEESLRSRITRGFSVRGALDRNYQLFRKGELPAHVRSRYDFANVPLPDVLAIAKEEMARIELELQEPMKPDGANFQKALQALKSQARALQVEIDLTAGGL